MFLFSKKSDVSWLVVFLGNPGAKYDNTRHNAGFIAADAVESLYSVSINRLKFHALTGRMKIGGETVYLIKPQTFMNLSGQAVGEAAAFYKIPTDHIIVISDDITLPVGKVRIRRAGSAGGHNGLKDIIAKCGSDAFPRIKLGVGIPPEKFDIADWVLSTFNAEDSVTIRESAEKAAKAIEAIITRDVDFAMNKFNN